MGIAVLILGESGTGKSASMRNFNPYEISLINVAGKKLPFKGHFEDVLKSDNYRTIKKHLSGCLPTIAVIDDAQYLLANAFMRRATEKGYDKFTELAFDYWDLIQYVNNDLPDEKIVFFLSHVERDQNGNEKVKTIGKLLDEKITVEGMFTIVLKTSVKDGKYTFITQNNGHDTVKSPDGMFPFEIDNDLKEVSSAICKYYGFLGEAQEVKNNDENQKNIEKKEGISKEDVEDNNEEVKQEEQPKRVRRTRKERD